MAEFYALQISPQLSRKGLTKFPIIDNGFHPFAKWPMIIFPLVPSGIYVDNYCIVCSLTRSEMVLFITQTLSRAWLNYT